jgi:hypothetical protein
MPTTTTNFGWTVPADTDLVKDGAAAIRTALGGPDASFIDLKGGTTGQVLAKASGTDLDFSWVAQDDSNAIQNAIVDAKGDLIAATAADTPARLAIGTNGQILTADSTEATGMKWAAPAGGGKVLQVVQGTHSTAVTISSTSFTDTGLTATITPSSATSKILVLVTQKYFIYTSTAPVIAAWRLMRDATVVNDYKNGSASLYAAPTSSQLYLGAIWNLSYLDSPATTSAITYKTQANVDNTGSSRQVEVQPQSAQSTIILMEIGA